MDDATAVTHGTQETFVGAVASVGASARRHRIARPCR
jgi:hypothetical protein